MFLDIELFIKPLSYYKYLTQNKYRKYITKEGREYKRVIEDRLTEEMEDKKILNEDIRVSLIFYFDNKRKNDIDNYAKPLLDFMSDIVYTDDRLIIELNIKKFYDKSNPRIHIIVSSNSGK